MTATIFNKLDGSYREANIDNDGGEISSILGSETELLLVSIPTQDKPTLYKVAKELALHPLSVEDALSENALPKIDHYSNYDFVIWNYLKKGEDGKLVRLSMSFFISDKYLIIVSPEKYEGIDRILGQCKLDKEYCLKGTKWLFHMIIDSLVDSYLPLADELSTQLEALQEDVFESADSQNFKDVFDIKRKLYVFRKVTFIEREVVNQLLRPEFIKGDDTIRFYFQDIYDNLLLIMDFIETERELINGVMEIHLSATSNHLNEVMKKLTVVATIFMPITFITSLYGMNFKFMPLLGFEYGFYIMSLFIIVITVYMLIVMKRKGWW